MFVMDQGVVNVTRQTNPCQECTRRSPPLAANQTRTGLLTADDSDVKIVLRLAETHKGDGDPLLEAGTSRQWQGFVFLRDLRAVTGQAKPSGLADVGPQERVGSRRLDPLIQISTRSGRLERIIQERVWIGGTGAGSVLLEELPRV